MVECMALNASNMRATSTMGMYLVQGGVKGLQSVQSESDFQKGLEALSVPFGPKHNELSGNLSILISL